MGSRTVVDMPVAVVEGVNTATPATWMVHTDHLHRPVRMTNSTKAAVWQATWSPWGAPHQITGSAVLDARFPGQWFQLEAGLHYNWHRQYDASLGRYTQPDPLGFVDGPSVYGYAGGSPLALSDRSGLASCTYSISTRTLTCRPKDPMMPPVTLPPANVFSGLGSCANNTSCINKKDEGPTPPGVYTMDYAPDKYNGSWILKPNILDRVLCRLDSNKRCGFFLHEGNASLGCITVTVIDDNWRRMKTMLINEPGSTMTVAP